MRRVIEIALCDLLSAHEVEEPAIYVDVSLTWDKKTVELDLCEKCMKWARSVLDALVNEGHKPGPTKPRRNRQSKADQPTKQAVLVKPAKPAEPAKPEPVKSAKPAQLVAPADDRKARMRTFADERGLQYKKLERKSQPGHYYYVYSAALERAFAEYERSLQASDA